MLVLLMPELVSVPCTSHPTVSSDLASTQLCLQLRHLLLANGPDMSVQTRAMAPVQHGWLQTWLPEAQATST